MSFLYVSSPESKVYISENRIICETGELKSMLPIELLEGVVLIGNANISSQCAKELLILGVPVSFISAKGKYFGRLESTNHMNIQRQRCQFRCGDNNDFCLEFAKKIIGAKIHNQSVIIRRYNRKVENEKILSGLQAVSSIEKQVDRCNDISQVMGHEGFASKKYFECLSHLVSNEFHFNCLNQYFTILLMFYHTSITIAPYNENIS